MVIVITGILSAIVAVFVRAPVDGYVNSVARAELTDAGDTALRRISRDVRAALPNSLRTTAGGSNACFEFLPTAGGGRYRVEQSSAATGDVLNFTAADNIFDVLASSNLPPLGGYGVQHHLVIYNLGIAGADAYDVTGTTRNRAAISLASAASPITLTAANEFPFSSPGNRVHVIPNFSVVYSCSGGQLLRSTQAIAAAPMVNCPVGGNKVMADIAPILGLVAEEKAPQIAVVRCAGSVTKAPKKVEYDGPKNCFFANNLYAGESGCPNGCLGLGDCVVSCSFDAIYIDNITGLPVVSEENCVACGACVKACPRAVIELRNKGPKGKRIFVSCINKEKGAIAKKNCEVACIGCGKCVKQCAYDAIKLENNLAYIDYTKCKLCRKCASECPTGAILEISFPERKAKEETNTTVTENS